MNLRNRKPTKVEQAIAEFQASANSVAERAKQLQHAMSHRKERARTNPFVRIDLDDEDSVVTTIENVIAVARTATKELPKGK